MEFDSEFVRGDLSGDEGGGLEGELMGVGSEADRDPLRRTRASKSGDADGVGLVWKSGADLISSDELSEGGEVGMGILELDGVAIDV